MFRIYLIQNVENGKVYVGKTIQPVIKRWNQHIDKAKYTQLNCYLHNAIRKYGSAMFKIREVDSVETEELANQRETYWIKWFRSHRPENGYNMTLGGDGAIGAVRSEKMKRKLSIFQTGRTRSTETRKKMSLSKQGQPGPWKGKSLSEEHKKKLSIANTGKKFSDEHKQKISASVKKAIANASSN